ncbi:hypothetical protein LEMA_P119660.1 [Plenodomus lingam JN3]|uniref:Lytic polysaccharide monooxygenase n=1 Tax=Leptosphaeria maculans (strain JN3 / isolate v23.1.3 / race Av1-4-5-6-7-8) TaxID=985895 RepID=E4ZT44_LEPMJ|nr:hypothetical protein LEMA_P119660.1 [Plenodomus lingam JN3]CBX94475.1 hypothetical protein LEMA_P119660.1 [Plenodomus lingam JN3]
MSFKSTIIAAAALLASVNAHIKITQPVPFSVATLDTAPITKSQYPCKSNLGFTVSTINSMKVGEPQTIKFSGTAVHGGGSCQLSVTTDPEPTENSIFKVIKSIEGGCPGVDGTTNEYEFTLPDSIPNGKATFSWTWLPKLSGGPEMYMNCAAIEVTGGASDDSAFKQLPDMLKANLDQTCKSEANFAVSYPSPGTAVQKGSTNDAKPPVGEACGLSSGTDPAEPSGSAGVEPPAVPTSPPSGQNPPTDTPTTPSTPSSPSEGGSSDTCTTNGAIICNGTTKFGLCNAGKVVWQDVAAGTTCTNGVIAKRGYNGRIARPRLSSPVDV